MDNREHIKLADVDIPKNYSKFSNDEKRAICNKLIDVLLFHIDKDLDPQYDRIEFLDDVFESSMISNEQMELYEICEVLYDCRKLLND
jgi:hypothetical protein